MKQLQLLLFLLLLSTAATQAQTIDSFNIDRSLSPHRLYVRLRFPDSSYYVNRTFDRVALIYPPVNLITFFYRSCDVIKAPPLMEIVMPIYTPDPYGLRLYLVRDSNTVLSGCSYATEILTVDTAIYTLPATTGINDPSSGTNSLHIFPNPAADQLNVSGAAGAELQISDALGRLQLRQQLQQPQETLNISTLAPGLYYIHCYRNVQHLQSLCFSKLP